MAVCVAFFSTPLSLLWSAEVRCELDFANATAVRQGDGGVAPRWPGRFFDSDIGAWTQAAPIEWYPGYSGSAAQARALLDGQRNTTTCLLWHWWQESDELGAKPRLYLHRPVDGWKGMELGCVMGVSAALAVFVDFLIGAEDFAAMTLALWLCSLCVLWLASAAQLLVTMIDLAHSDEMFLHATNTINTRLGFVMAALGWRLGHRRGPWILAMVSMTCELGLLSTRAAAYPWASERTPTNAHTWDVAVSELVLAGLMCPSCICALLLFGLPAALGAQADAGKEADAGQTPSCV